MAIENKKLIDALQLVATAAGEGFWREITRNIRNAARLEATAIQLGILPDSVQALNQDGYRQRQNLVAECLEKRTLLKDNIVHQLKALLNAVWDIRHLLPSGLRDEVLFNIRDYVSRPEVAAKLFGRVLVAAVDALPNTEDATLATPATPASSGGDAQANLSVTDVYVPATAVFRLQDKYKTYKQFKRWLDSIPPDVIRRKKPTRNRLLIHAADFVKYWRRMFDATFEILDEVAERMETMRDKKRNKAHKQKDVKAEQLNTLFIPGYGR